MLTQYQDPAKGGHSVDRPGTVQNLGSMHSRNTVHRTLLSRKGLLKEHNR